MAQLILDVYLDGRLGDGEPRRIGCIQRDDHGSTEFRYDADYDGPPLSLALPVRAEAYGDTRSRAFFSNLIFESPQRHLILEKYQLDPADYAGMLAHIGADCPGAVSVVPQGAPPAKQPGNLDQDYDYLSEAQVREIAISLRDRQRIPDEVKDPSPLAGVQNKIGLVHVAGRGFALPREGSGAPTTHILKVSTRERPSDHLYEATAMRIMRDAMSFLKGGEDAVAHVEAIDIGDVPALLVERFDRRIEGGMVYRVHQEDFVQALGLSPGGKYERPTEPGAEYEMFSARKSGLVLSRLRRRPEARTLFLHSTMARLILGDTDGHAKNHAVLHLPDGPHLAPIYDVFPTMTDGRYLHTLSMRMGKAWIFEDMEATDLVRYVEDLGFRGLPKTTAKSLAATVKRVVEAANAMQGPRFKIFRDVVNQQAKALGETMELGFVPPEADLVPVARPDFAEL